jgi:hypothetical protein
MYSENDERILLRWQGAKHWYDLLEQFEAVAWSLSPSWEERNDRDRAILNEYGAARIALDSLRDPTLAAIVKRLRPDFPAGGSSETPDGRVILAAAETDMRTARQELFDISLEIKDLRPPTSKAV